MYTHQSILGNYCGQDGWQHVYTSTYILSFFPHICGHISVAVTVMTTDSAWTSVFGLSPTHTEEVKLFSVLFSAGSNIIIRPQSSLSPSRCGRQRDVLLTQGSRWIREASALCYGGGDDTTGLWMTLSLWSLVLVALLVMRSVVLLVSLALCPVSLAVCLYMSLFAFVGATELTHTHTSVLRDWPGKYLLNMRNMLLQLHSADCLPLLRPNSLF